MAKPTADSLVLLWGNESVGGKGDLTVVGRGAASAAVLAAVWVASKAAQLV